MSAKAQSLELEAAKRIRYSPESDVLYFLFAEGEEEYFEEPISGVHIEYDEKGNLLGIEVLNASWVLKDVLAQMIKNLLPHAEAQALENVKKLLQAMKKQLTKT